MVNDYGFYGIAFMLFVLIVFAVSRAAYNRGRADGTAEGMHDANKFWRAQMTSVGVLDKDGKLAKFVENSWPKGEPFLHVDVTEENRERFLYGDWGDTPKETAEFPPEGSDPDVRFRNHYPRS